MRVCGSCVQGKTCILKAGGLETSGEFTADTGYRVLVRAEAGIQVL